MYKALWEHVEITYNVYSLEPALNEVNGGLVNHDWKCIGCLAKGTVWTSSKREAPPLLGELFFFVVFFFQGFNFRPIPRSAKQDKVIVHLIVGI